MAGEFYQSDNVYRVLFTPGMHETEINKLTYDTELESIYLTGSFGVRASSPVTYGERKSVFAGRDFTLTEMPKKADISKVTENGFWFFAGRMELFGKICIEPKKNVKYVLSAERLYCPDAEIAINGKAGGCFRWHPLSLM